MKKLAVLIADICGSTALYENIGDGPARQLIEKGIATMVGEIAAYQGLLINTIGDQILCTFPHPEAALQAACAMQNAVKNSKFEEGHVLQIRIGLHYGDVILENNAAFGDTVNVTARVAAIARANQIMTTKAVFAALPPDLKEKTHQFMSADLKGKLNPYDIFLVVWEQDDLLTTCFNIPAPRRTQVNKDELALFYCGQFVRVNNERKMVTMGRGDNCDIIVHNNYASRQHVHCEWRFGKFFIVDHSINGTYIRFSDNTVISLIRQEMILQGSGAISLGHDNFDISTELVEFLINPSA
ncbi:adenylate/guanylate cyclase domain-containing protein [Candidatus Methylobacter favarea]|uniref:adenylate/guanylate cyclase domain-containing protein n=1 Tax=Candidatus Methylobacter favarea TaxID=2707345 RepID=UPI00157DBBB7|nr:adenylate/guanylate cyclase domain-containing protein [Candidatus Methylobacter favarea]